jgi:hypothetical protein
MFPDFSGDKIPSAKERVDKSLERTTGGVVNNSESENGKED